MTRWRRDLAARGVRAGWRDGRLDGAAWRIGAGLGILAGLAVCVGLMLG